MRLLFGLVLLTICAFHMLGDMWGSVAVAQAATAPKEAMAPATLEREFFAAIREADSRKFLSYISEGGVNVGPRAEHIDRDEIAEQLLKHRGIYCKLFDSSCIDGPINLGGSARACSDRELLTTSSKVRTAATETTRNGVRQAILVAEVKNDNCPADRLIDFIFNQEAGGWKLFSMP